MNSSIADRLTLVRKIMHREMVDALYISGTDPHLSEYLCEHWQTRRYFTGFSGSYGEVVILPKIAGLWTDTRYFLQAGHELEGSGIEMHKLRVPEAVSAIDWLLLHLAPGERLAVDPISLPFATYHHFQEKLRAKQIELVFLPELYNEIWTDRPSLPKREIFVMPDEIAGKSVSEKIDDVLAVLRSRQTTATVISALDEVAWLFNLRGSDIRFAPLFMAYAVVGVNHRAIFVHKQALSSAARRLLADNAVEVHDYETIFDFLTDLHHEIFLVEPHSVSTAVWLMIKKGDCVMADKSLVATMKASKNATEIEGFRHAMLKDGVVMVTFLKWLNDTVGKAPITEYDVSTKLTELRSLQPEFVGESFESISAYRDHGAMVHMSVDANNAYPLEPDGLLLTDSGGQYLSGTTDITRTVALGKVTERQKRDFTLVLKGMIKLTMAVFPYGTKGIQLDSLARQSLWEDGLNYGHGTGHGVGHFLSVHEGPVSIRPECNPNEIVPGMVFSNEPGVYREGEYGIRIENLLLCVEKETTPFGRFLGFDTLTLCPIDNRLLIPEMLLPAERQWLNDYHERVRKTLTPLLDDVVKSYLVEITQPA